MDSDGSAGQIWIEIGQAMKPVIDLEHAKHQYLIVLTVAHVLVYPYHSCPVSAPDQDVRGLEPCLKSPIRSCGDIESSGSARLRGACVMQRKLRFAAALLAVGIMMPIGCGKMGLPPAGPPDVEVVEVAQKDVPITKEWVATLDGLVNAQIRAQVTGLLLKQSYINGAFVRKGDPLFNIDPRPFQAALDQAKGNLSEAQASLAQARARLGKTQIDVTRYTPLAKESAISQQELDDAIQADLAAKAQVEGAQATIAGAQAAVEKAQLNLDFTRITSPVDGVAAIASAQVGDLVGPASPALTTVSTMNPILVNFTASEQEYLTSMKQYKTEDLSEIEALRKLVWQLRLTDGSIYPLKGQFYALDRQVDVRTGAILVQVQFPNPGNMLRPGGFGSISTVVRIQHNALLVPQRAVSELQGGFIVAVVSSDNKASLRPVKMGQKTGDMWIVDEGLKPGERVVAEGVQKVQEGTLVKPKPYKPGMALAENSKASGSGAP
jgi:membrane fusion protein, multidrug efflux system